MQNFQDILAKIRQHYGVKTTKEAMAKWGVPRGTYSTWVSNKRIPEKRLKDWCLKEGVSYEWLVGSDDLPTGDLYSADQVREIYSQYGQEQERWMSPSPKAIRLAKAFDALDDAKKEALFDDLMHRIAAGLTSKDDS